MASKIPVPVATGHRDHRFGVGGNSSPSHVVVGRESPHSTNHHPHYLNHRSSSRPVNASPSDLGRNPIISSAVPLSPKFEAFVMTGDLMINLAARQTSDSVLSTQCNREQMPMRRKKQPATTSSIQLGDYEPQTQGRTSLPTSPVEEMKTQGRTSLPTSPVEEMKTQSTLVCEKPSHEEMRDKSHSSESNNCKVRLSRSEDHLLQEPFRPVELDENVDDVNNQSNSLEMLLKSDRRSQEVSMSSSLSSANSGRASSLSPASGINNNANNDCSSGPRSSRGETSSQSESVDCPVSSSPSCSETNGSESIPPGTSPSSGSFTASLLVSNPTQSFIHPSSVLVDSSNPLGQSFIHPSSVLVDPNASLCSSNSLGQSSGNRTFSKSELQEIASAMSLSSSSESSPKMKEVSSPKMNQISSPKMKEFCSEVQPTHLEIESGSEVQGSPVANLDSDGPKRYPSFLAPEDDGSSFLAPEDDGSSSPEPAEINFNVADGVDGSVPRSVDVASASRLAKRLYDLQGFKKSDVARHLSKNNDFSRIVAEEYLKLLRFEGDGLDAAIHKFISRFHLVGETQERERVLEHFSKRYFECNPGTFESSDAVHTLTCALMLLNTDLHGENVGRKMTCNEFIGNLSQLEDGKKFPEDILRSLYTSIKNDPLEWARDDEEGKLNGSKGGNNLMSLFGAGDGGSSSRSGETVNPFLELPKSGANEFKKGYLVRKCCFDANGRRTPLGKRGWRMFFATLRDLVLYLHKDESGFRKNQLYESLNNSIRIHHALASKALDYTKKEFVLRLQTADRAEYLFKASDAREQQSWVDAINLAAASLSSPPLAPAIGSQPSKFQRPLLPVSHTKFSLREQLMDHEARIQKLEAELESHQNKCPPRSATRRVMVEYEEKESFLLHEIKRYKAYSTLLKMRLQQTLGAQVLDKVLQKSMLTGGPIKSKPLTSLSIGEEVIKDDVNDEESDLSDQDPVIEPARKRRPRTNRSSQ